MKITKTVVLIWIVANVLCSPLFYAWDVTSNENGVNQCQSNYWAKIGEIIFYSVQTLMVNATFESLLNFVGKLNSMEAINLIFLPLTFFVVVGGLFGNTCMLIAIIKYKHLRSPVNILLANVAVSDMMCILFSISDVIEFFYGKWILGDVYCRIHGAFIEVSYTVSVFSLTTVAVERYWSLCRPFGIIHTQAKIMKTVVLIWVVAIILCSPLFYAWGVTPNENGVNQCQSNYWAKIAEIIFYSVQTLLVYVLPLIFMIKSHFRIFNMLQRKIYHTSNDRSQSDGAKRNGFVERRSVDRLRSKQRQRNHRVNRLLLIVTIMFFLLWTPFVVIRMLRFYIYVPEVSWKISQFLVMVMCSINFFIYAYASPELRKTFKTFIIVRSKHIDKRRNVAVVLPTIR